MRPAHLNPSSPFGRREPHTITIARGDNIRQFQLRPWSKASLLALGSALLFGYVASTGYLVLRDDLLAAKMARQALIEHAYEDRISSLRRQVDRITSRQMLDQNLVETRMAELMRRQDILATRSEQITPLLREFGVTTGAVPLPQARPDRKASGPSPVHSLLAATEREAPLSLADRADIAFVALQHSLEDMEIRQLQEIGEVVEKTENATAMLKNALGEIGLSHAGRKATTGMGGPFEPAGDEPTDAFGAVIERLDSALAHYSDARRAAVSVPLANPLPGRAISSNFGVRKDPLVGRRAMHSGLDFSAPRGAPILAAADGLVVKAGRHGGYGKMVEIRHADGFVTRYAHMNRINVTKGQSVERGAIVGKVGSTGRSTGPHLHYEVRRQGDALNPMRFLKAGETVKNLL